MPYLKKITVAGKTIDMQNHVLPYLQSGRKGVQERRI